MSGCHGSPVPSVDAAAASHDASGPIGSRANPAVNGESFDIRYAVHASRPPTDVELRVPPAGDATLLLLAAPGILPGEPLGYFEVPVSQARRSALARFVKDRDLLARDRGATATPEGSGTIELRANGHAVTIGLATADDASARLRVMLDEIVEDQTRRPVRALRLTTTAVTTERAEVTLTRIGVEPLDLLFFDPGDAALWVRTNVTVSRDGKRDSASLQRADVLALVDGNKLPSGVTSSPPRTTYSMSVPTPSTAKAGTGCTLSATMLVWLAGPGLARRPVSLTSSASPCGQPAPR